MGAHLRVFSRSYPINTNMTQFRWFLLVGYELTLVWVDVEYGPRFAYILFYL